jgi:hypothetical protein
MILHAHKMILARKRRNQKQAAASSSSKKSRRTTLPSSNDDDDVTENDDVVRGERIRMEHTSRRVSARNSDKRAAQEAAEQRQQQQSKHDDIAEGQQQASNTAPTAVWVFGRALESLLSSASSFVTPAVVLGVDHAERLLSLGSSSNSRVNFLAQLLLLPRTLGLNVTILVITKSIMLEHCSKWIDCAAYQAGRTVRLGSILIANKIIVCKCLLTFAVLNNVSSQGTIAGHINPLRLHFSAYQGKSTIQSVRSLLRALK